MSGPPQFLSHGLVWLHRRLRRAVDRLAPTELLLSERISGVQQTAVAGLLVTSGLADRLDGQVRTAASLVGQAVPDARTVERILRGAAALGLIRRSGGGYRANRLTRGLQGHRPRSLSALATYFASSATLEAWSRLPEAVRQGAVPFRQAHGEGVWERLARSDGEGALFARAMEELTRLDAELVVATPAFADLPVLCDVAGGTGALLEVALLRHPGLRGVLVDSPQVIALARSRLEAAGVLPRIELHAADVFQSVPRGLAAYVMKDVLHDWNDARAEMLLRVVREAIAPGGRLLLVEVLIGRPSLEEVAATVDLQMLAVTDGGRQRSARELEELLRATGFSTPVVHSTALASSVLEARAV